MNIWDNKNALNNEFNMEGCFVLNYEQLLNVNGAGGGGPSSGSSSTPSTPSNSNTLNGIREDFLNTMIRAIVNLNGNRLNATGGPENTIMNPGKFEILTGPIPESGTFGRISFEN